MSTYVASSVWAAPAIAALTWRVSWSVAVRPAAGKVRRATSPSSKTFQ
jgi:hypothetical protein